MPSFLASLLGTRFWLTAYATFALGFVIPGEWQGWQWSLPILLGGILFFTSLKLSLSEVLAAMGDRRRWRQVTWMTAVKLLALPLLAWAITMLVAPAWAAGVLLLCAMPAGLSSIAFTDILKGNHVLALLLVVAGSVLVPLTVPLLLLFLGPAGTHVVWSEISARAAYILTVLAVPFTLAQVVRRLAPALVARHYRHWSRGAVVCSSLLGMLSVLVNRGSWAAWQPAQLAVPLILVCGLSLLSLLLGWWSQRALPRADATAFACGIVYMNNGLSVAFAARFFSDQPVMVLPSVLMQIPMIGAVALIGRFAHTPPEAEVSA
jgi:predicted Na+-dependent transporter